MFLFYYVVSFSRKLSEKNSPSLRSGFLRKIFGSELWVFGTCARLMYFGAVLAYVFALLCGVILPKGCLQKLSYLLVHSLASVSLPVCLSVCLSVWSGRGCPWSPREGLLDGYVSQSVSQSETILLCNRCVCNWKMNSQTINVCNWRVHRKYPTKAPNYTKKSCQKTLWNSCPVQLGY